MLENDTDRIRTRITDDHKLSSTMPLNIPTSREYGRFALTTTTAKNSTSPITTPRDGNINTGRYQTTDNIYRHNHSPRPMTRITDYLNERPVYPQPYVSPSSNLINKKLMNWLYNSF